MRRNRPKRVSKDASPRSPSSGLTPPLVSDASESVHLERPTHTRRAPFGRWSHAEDGKLTRAVKKIGDEDWRKVAQSVKTKSRDSCYQHWHRVLKPSLRKGVFSRELVRLAHAVGTCGTHRWTQIANLVGDRSDTHCRSRWFMVEKERDDFDRQLLEIARNGKYFKERRGSPFQEKDSDDIGPMVKDGAGDDGDMMMMMVDEVSASGGGGKPRMGSTTREKRSTIDPCPDQDGSQSLQKEGTTMGLSSSKDSTLTVREESSREWHPKPWTAFRPNLHHGPFE